MVKVKIEKLESQYKVCLFVGCSKETRRYLFYSHQNNKVFVSTNVIFLDNDFKACSKVLLDELQSNVIKQTPSIRNDI